MQSVKVSVIIPVYNVEEYIDRCIESLKVQKLDGLEVLFVDDCSTDNSVKKIEAYLDDARFHLIHTEKNLGPGGTRNLGIEHAKGQYLSFIDPDDWIAPNFYSLLYEKAQSTGCRLIKGKRVSFEKDLQVKTEDLNQRIRERLGQGWPLYALWTYEHQTGLFHAGLFQDPDVRYGSSRVGQDTTFLLKICIHANDIAFEDRAIYFYQAKRENSRTQDFSPERIDYELDHLSDKISILCRKGLNEFDYQYIINHLLTRITVCYDVIRNHPEIQSALEERLCKRLISIIGHIPDYQRIMSEIAEIDVLMRYGCLIPSSYFGSVQFAGERIRRWTNLLTADSGNTIAYVEKDADAVISYLWLYVKYRRNLEKRYAIRFVYGQLQRLPRQTRRKVYRKMIRVFWEKAKYKINRLINRI